ncbi:exodeoxyribonuclease VII small subunit [Candidatus Saccharibacteria bacterium]|nr:exodeoxyribonuclease VII small subunit [Candidatus Saccharibacteria bacterium]MBQ6149586.1 exodeoxyribonuclease VII small subunit [Candidatus Saccharibacteria bacterium]
MSEKTLNQKLKDLDKQVEWFYSDDFKLEKASEKYKEALKLSEEIEKDLKNLKNEIEVLNEDFTK